MSNWITISINPPVIGTPIAVRTADKFDLGHTYSTFDFTSEMFDQEEFETMLAGTDYVEWMDLS